VQRHPDPVAPRRQAHVGPSSTAAAAAEPSGRIAAPTGWTTYHGDDARTGFVAATSPVSALRRRPRTRLDGAVYAQPSSRRAAAAVTIAVTENDTVYALRDGRTIWRTRSGRRPRSALPCGNIDPLGITGTPVVDPRAGVVYVAAELNDPIRHELVALDTRRGRRWRRSVDPPAAQPRYEQQRPRWRSPAAGSGSRSAGSSGTAGRTTARSSACGRRQGALAVHQVPTTREAGSGRRAGRRWVRRAPLRRGRERRGDVRGLGRERLDPRARHLGRVVSSFAPADWAQENAQDLDLGSMGPLLLPRGLVVASGKGGDVYVLRQGNLGGIGRPLAARRGCAAYGGGGGRPGDGGTATVFLPCRDGVAALRGSPRRARSRSSGRRTARSPGRRSSSGPRCSPSTRTAAGSSPLDAVAAAARVRGRRRAEPVRDADADGSTPSSAR
jgi:hypothetical protein